MATNDMQIPIQSALDIGGNHFNKDGRDHPVPSQYKGLMTVLVGEFCGTFMFLLLSFIGTQAALDNNSPAQADAVLSPSSLLFIALSVLHLPFMSGSSIVLLAECSIQL